MKNKLSIFCTLNEKKNQSDTEQILTLHTGKSMSEVLIFASTNPQYDNRFSIKLPNSKLRTLSEHVLYTLFVLFLFWHSQQFVYTTSTDSVLSLEFLKFES